MPDCGLPGKLQFAGCISSILHPRFGVAAFAPAYKGHQPLVAKEKSDPASSSPSLATPNGAPSAGLSTVTAKAIRAAQVIVISSVTFTFISYWRTAAVVLCDLASTAYYIGAIVESAIGKAAPWFIVGVLLFSYAMRAVYIESCSLFVRGGVYRVVKEAMGGFVAKLSVSALLFDYILTGPISGVSAGQYIVGLGLEACTDYLHIHIPPELQHDIKSWGAVVIACLTTLYFFRQNILGIHESSDKALKIMIATTIMGLVILVWSGVTLAVKGPVNPVPSWRPDLSLKTTISESGQTVPKMNLVTGRQEDPLGFLGRFPSIAEPLRHSGGAGWLGLIGLVGIVIAFGHSILAMSGEETLAQVYREVESPKLPNFKKAAFIVFVYSLLLTGTVSFLAVVLIPDELRMGKYYDNFIGGLAMQMVGPLAAQAAAQRVRGGGRILDSVGGGQHVDHRLQRRAQPRRRRRRAARLVSQAARALRDDVADFMADRGLAAVHDHRQPRGRYSPRRSVRVRRRLELYVQNAFDGGAAIQGSHPARIQGPAQRSDWKARAADRPVADLR